MSKKSDAALAKVSTAAAGRPTRVPKKFTVLKTPKATGKKIGKVPNRG